MSKLDKLRALAKPSNWEEKAQRLCENDHWMDDAARIAVRILYGLKTSNMSQKDLAFKLGITPQAVTKIVKGRQNLTIGTIRKIESALGIDLFAIPTLHTDLIPMPGPGISAHFSQSKTAFSGGIDQLPSDKTKRKLALDNLKVSA